MINNFTYSYDSPFAIACPYPGACGTMEANDFPTHVKACHKDAKVQRLQCPICALQMENLPPLVEGFSLLVHLDDAHKDLVPSFNYLSLTESGAISPSVQLGKAQVKDILEADIPDKECIICFDVYSKGDDVTRLDCWCFFHSECIEEWFEQKGGVCCPVHNREETDGAD